MFRLRKTKATPPPATLINQLQQFQTSTSGAHDFSSLENTPGIRGPPVLKKVTVDDHPVNLANNLPPLRTITDKDTRDEVFLKKVQMCNNVFIFSQNEEENLANKNIQIKKDILLELHECIGTVNVVKSFQESTLQELVAMVERNIFRPLPEPVPDFDPEEDDPILDPAWMHLQLIYDMFLRFVLKSEVTGLVLEKYISQIFCQKLVNQFNCMDPRERDYLKAILHRIYAKIVAHRRHIRTYIRYSIYQFVYETEVHWGMGELLEILGSIINGFAVPIRKEHLNFLRYSLVPLHKPPSFIQYCKQLQYCFYQFVEKDPTTGECIVRGLLKYWPVSSSQKAIQFVSEVEDILVIIQKLSFENRDKVLDLCFTILAKGLESPHFQVIERVITLFYNDSLIGSDGILNSKKCGKIFFPYLYGPLKNIALNSWHSDAQICCTKLIEGFVLETPTVEDYYKQWQDKKLQAQIKGNTIDEQLSSKGKYAPPIDPP